MDSQRLSRQRLVIAGLLVLAGLVVVLTTRSLQEEPTDAPLSAPVPPPSPRESDRVREPDRTPQVPPRPAQPHTLLEEPVQGRQVGVRREWRPPPPENVSRGAQQWIGGRHEDDEIRKVCVDGVVPSFAPCVSPFRAELLEAARAALAEERGEEYLGARQ